MTEELLLILELGTFKASAHAVNRDLQILQTATHEIAAFYPQYGWLEHNPEEIWNAAQRSAQKILNQFGRTRFAGMAVTNQRGSVVLWDREKSQAVYPALGDMDRRAEKICQVLRINRREPMLHYRTGGLLEAYSPAAKIAWLLQNVSGALEKIKRGELAVGTLDSWILWKLTDGKAHVTDVSNAARTLLYDLNTRRWESQLLAAFEIPAAGLPRVLPTLGPYGETAPSQMGCSLPILAVVENQLASLFAMRTNPGSGARLHFGKELLVQCLVGKEPLIQPRLSSSIAWQSGEEMEFLYETAAVAGGVVQQWLKDGIQLIPSYPEAEKMAISVPDTGGVVMIPALAGLGFPWGDPNARGAFLGLNFKTTRAHMVRAFFEGTAQQVADILENLELRSNVNIHSLRADGEMARNHFLLQFQADLLGIPIESPACLETSALGAAQLAGMANGFWNEEWLAAWQLPMEKRYEPVWSETERKKSRSHWQLVLERAQAWVKPE